LHISGDGYGSQFRLAVSAESLQVAESASLDQHIVGAQRALRLSIPAPFPTFIGTWSLFAALGQLRAADAARWLRQMPFTNGDGLITVFAVLEGAAPLPVGSHARSLRGME